MKFLMVSDDGAGCGAALRIAEEGNEIAVSIMDPFGMHSCDGLVMKVEEYDFTIDEDTILIFDSTGMGTLADAFLKAGFAVVGGSGLMDRLENDRRFAYQQIRKLGMAQPKAWFYNDWESAKAFVAGDGAKSRLVFKPCGEHSGNVPSYVSADAEDLLAMLAYYEREMGRRIDFMLQEFVAGVEVDTALWFSHGKPLLPADRTLETKKLMDGDRGPAGGCSGNILYAVDWDRITASQLDKILPWAQEQNYTGIIQVNAIATDKDVFVLEFTPRMGYDCEPTVFNELLDGELGKFFADVALGQASSIPLRAGFAGGIRLSISPYPSSRAHAPSGIPLRGIKNFDHFYPYDIERDDELNLLSSGGEGKIGVATGLADTIPDAIAAAEKVAGAVVLPDVQYRLDLAGLFQKRFDEVKSLL
jgi:phosphoribosylamine-glycine ligase